MNRNLKVILLPTVFLILVIGCLVPGYRAFQEERCNLAWLTLVESDLLDTKSADEIFAEHPESVAYLLKHPKMTLRICLRHDENTESQDAAVLYALAGRAYEKVTKNKLPMDQSSLKEAVRAGSPELYEELRGE